MHQEAMLKSQINCDATFYLHRGERFLKPLDEGDAGRCALL